MVLNELDGTKFGRVLLGMPGLGKLILDKIFPIDTGCPFSRLDLGIVPTENVGCPFLSDEIFVCLRHLAFGLHPINVDHVGLYTIEDLSTRCAADGSYIGKVSVRGYRFP